jgi:hypothetical protein
MRILHQPLKVFWICLSVAMVSLLLNGGLFQLYKLHRDQALITAQIEATQMQVSDLNHQLKMAKDPAFIERQALDNYDLVSENDLVFVFADQ